MYDITTAVIRGQGGPHIGHEALLRQALLNTRENGTYVHFMGSAQARPEPSNPFSWQQRAIPVRACLERLKAEIGKEIHIRILPLRDRLTNLQWTNSLYSAIVEIAAETGADLSNVAIVDANKNGDQSAYQQWFKGKLHVLAVGIIPGIHATAIRKKFFLNEVDPYEIEGLTPEAVAFLTEWKASSGEFNWLQSEFRFKEGFARPLSNLPRAVVCSGSRILLFRRTSHSGTGYNQYDVPLDGTGYELQGENSGYKVIYPGIHTLLMAAEIELLHLANFKDGTPSVGLYDIDGSRKNGFFGLQNGWQQVPSIGTFQDRVALLSTPLTRNVYPSLINDRQELYIPEWVAFAALPSIQFFRRETVLYLERVLGEIPVLVDGAFV